MSEKVKPKSVRTWTSCTVCGKKTGNSDGVCGPCKSEKVKPKCPICGGEMTHCTDCGQYDWCVVCYHLVRAVRVQGGDE